MDIWCNVVSATVPLSHCTKKPGSRCKRLIAIVGTKVLTGNFDGDVASGKRGTTGYRRYDSMLSSLLHKDTDPKAIISRINNSLHHNIVMLKYIEAPLGILEIKSAARCSTSIFSEP